MPSEHLPCGNRHPGRRVARKFRGQPEHVVNYLFMVAEELRGIMAELGLRTVNEMIGRTELLETDAAISHWKAGGLDLSKILEPAQILFPGTDVYCNREQDHGLDKALDNELIRLAEPALARGEKVRIELEVKNTNRVVGTMLSNELARRRPEQMLPDDSIDIRLRGSAGQSLGAWLARAFASPWKAMRTIMSARACPAASWSFIRPGKAPFGRKRTFSSAMWCSTAPRAARRISAASRRSALRCATAAPSRWWRALAITAANT